jgi:Glycosyl hydrolases family 43
VPGTERLCPAVAIRPVGSAVTRTGYDSVVQGRASSSTTIRPFYSGDVCCGPEARYAFIAPGHNSVAADEAGADWIVYHAMPSDTETFERIMLVDRIRWVDGWPVVGDLGQPSSEPGRRPNACGAA